MSGAMALLDTPTLDSNRKPNVVAVRFWTEYAPDPANPGAVRGSDMVLWAKRGDLTSSAIADKVERVRRPLKELDDAGNPVPNPVWIGIQKGYAAWKAGEELVPVGTPLEAWAAVSKGQVAALKVGHVRSVEDLAAVSDSDLGRIMLPDARRLRDLARAFIANQQGIAQVDALMSERDAKMAEMEAQAATQAAVIAEMQAMMAAQREMQVPPVAPAPTSSKGR